MVEQSLASEKAQGRAPIITKATEILVRLGVRVSFARDEEIYAQDVDADLIYYLVSGAIRTTRLTADGRRKIGEFYYPGQIFGLGEGAVHRFSAGALSDSVVFAALRPAPA